MRFAHKQISVSRRIGKTIVKTFGLPTFRGCPYAKLSGPHRDLSRSGNMG